MAYTPTYVKDLQEKHNAIYWKVYDKTGRFLLDANESTNDLTESIDTLQTTLNNVVEEYVKVKLFKLKPVKIEKEGTRVPHFEFLVKTGKPGQVATQNNPYLSGQPTWVDMMAMSDKVRNLELEKLRTEIESEKETGWQNRLLDILESNPQIVSGIIAIFSQIKTSPQPKAAPKIAEPENKNVVNDFYSTIKTIDEAGAEETIEKIKAAIQADPNTYWNIKKFL